MNQLLVGADPELFLTKGGVFHSGYGIIPGTKIAPFPVEDGAVQVDGMAVEFNITPASNEEQFVTSVHKVMHQLEAMIPKQFHLNISPVAEFAPEHMEAQPEDAKKLGCDPDFNAYTGLANPRPDQHPTMRTAAGHIHLGWCQDRDPHDLRHFMSCCELAKQLDLYLGVPSVLMDPDTKRKQMYGKAGAFRPKPYGLEYRVLSNFWLKSDKLMRWAYRQTHEAFDSLVRRGAAKGCASEIENLINTNNKQVAQVICDAYGLEVLRGKDEK